MDVLLVGAGGRENALGGRIARAPSCTRLVVTGPNPGWPARAELRPAAGDAIVALAREIAPDLVVVGPEAPLADGLADRLAEIGIPCFGPSAAAARLETSKAFTKEILVAAGVPTACVVVADRADPTSWEAGRDRAALGRVVVKADGLAAGKGVIVCVTPDEGSAAFEEITRFGAAADRVLLEDLLTGPEVSVFALCDGERCVALPTAQDHKRLGDGDRGPNTGGMGAYAPCPLLPDPASILDLVHRPVLAEMARRGTPFRGVLYAGIMLTPDGPQVLEFNVRFGDPECQALMLLWEDDPLPWLLGAATGQLPAGNPRFRDGAALCVVLAAPGYPENPRTGTPIPHGGPVNGGEVFYAGARESANLLPGPGVGRRDPSEAPSLVTSGGRVLGITAYGADLRQARDRAYEAAERWAFEGAQLRRDIGWQAL